MAVIVTGHQRSGTTMLMKLLNSHRDVFIANEIGVFSGLQSGWRERLWCTIRRWKGISLNSVPIQWAEPEDRSLAGTLVSNHLFMSRLAFSLMLTIRQSRSIDAAESVVRKRFRECRVVGDKYPDYIFELNRFIKNRRFSTIVIYRDCRDVVSSTLQILENRWQYLPHLTRFVKEIDSVEKVALRWKKAIEQMLRYQDDLLCIRYEELVNDPPKLTGVLSDRIDVDPAYFDQSIPVAASIGKHKQYLTYSDLKRIEKIAGSLQEKLGYL